MCVAALYYDGIGSEIGTEMALGEAHRLNQAAAVAAARGPQEAGQDEEPMSDRDDPAPIDPASEPSQTTPGRTSMLSPPPTHHAASAADGKVKVATKDARKKSGNLLFKDSLTNVVLFCILNRHSTPPIFPTVTVFFCC